MKPQSRIYIESPLGAIAIEGEDNFITSVLFADDMTIDDTNPTEEMLKCKNELEEYFSGALKSFTINLKPAGTTFQQRVWNKLPTISYGDTISYSKIAEQLGLDEKIANINHNQLSNDLKETLMKNKENKKEWWKLIGKDDPRFGDCNNINACLYETLNNQLRMFNFESFIRCLERKGQSPGENYGKCKGCPATVNKMPRIGNNEYSSNIDDCIKKGCTKVVY